MHKRKLIEVGIPLEVINRESARENYIYRGNPSSIHKWWAQRPLAAARAVLFAQLVDDPSSNPDRFPTEEDQRRERDRLHRLIERLVVWENAGDERLMAEARAEILDSTGGTPPAIYDPFAGGGTIPLEAQRLGLEAHASDLNPVAVLLNKALLEIPPRFAGRPPAFPGLAGSQIGEWTGPDGLAADLRAYGDWVREQALALVRDHYPDEDGDFPIAWLWARTVLCPNPGCGIELPLVKSWWLGKRKGKEAFAIPRVIPDSEHSSGLRVEFEIGLGSAGPLTEPTMAGRQGATCIACSAVVSKDHIKTEGLEGRIGASLIATVVERPDGRTYRPASDLQKRAAEVDRPDDVPEQELAHDPRSLWTPQYGLSTFADLFTNRQLRALSAFCDVIATVKDRVADDSGDDEYAVAVCTYLALSLSKITDYVNSLSAWYPQENRPTHLFTRQTIPMVWDFAELNPFTDIGGGWSRSVKVVSESFSGLRATEPAFVRQGDAAAANFTGKVVSTDPPYYDNIGYSDLADFFYVWLRRSLRNVYPELFGTMMVPKAEELVANPYRHGGKESAEEFFESGFRRVFARAREQASPEVPITVYYAFKQSEKADSGESSTGWETLLEGMIQSGWEITSTWPLRSERGGRMIGLGKNALASSIVLSLRPRSSSAGSTDRRGFIGALEDELPAALRRLQQGAIAPVDLPQAAIGPGMAVFSRFGAVLEPDGTKMTVRSALARINEVLDQVLNEQEGDFDPTSRFAIAWYRQHGYGVGAFGDADNLARARNTSVVTMERDEILTSRAGSVQLIRPGDLSWEYDVLKDLHTSNWEALHHLIKVLERDGIAPAGDFLRAALGRPDAAVDADLVKELAHLLFRIAESNGWTKDALSFNSLVASWPEILEVARSANQAAQHQTAFDFDEEDKS